MGVGPQPEQGFCQFRSFLKHLNGMSEKKFGSRLFGHSRSPSMEFKELTKKDAQISLAMELDKLLKTLPEGSRQVVEQDFDGFKNLFGKFINSTGPSVNWDKIEKLPQESIEPYSHLPCPESKEAVKALLDQLVVIKLNGGLGTSMGCSGPKSVIPVRNDLTFLDLTVQQIEYLNKKYDANVPLVLMNSFNTDEDTMKIIRKYSGFKVQIKTFNQSCYPRISKESLMPVAKSSKTETDLGKSVFSFAFLLHSFFRILVPTWSRRFLSIILKQWIIGRVPRGW